MSKTKSISVKGVTYRRLQILCRRLNKPICGYVERLIIEKLDRLENDGLGLWECSYKDKTKVVAAFSKDEALMYAHVAIGCPRSSVDAKRSSLRADPGKLHPGVLSPEEQRMLIR